MFNHLKNWWQIRKAKHYLKSHWHLLADIFLLLIIICLSVYLIIVSKTPQPKVDTTSIKHVPQTVIGTSTESLIIKSNVDQLNIYSGKSFTLLLTLENNGRDDISEINLTPNFKSSGFTVSNLTSKIDSSGFRIKNNNLIIDRLLPGEKLELAVSLVLTAKPDSARAVSWFLKTTFIKGGSSYVKNYNLDTLKLITNLKVKANAYYHSSQGDQLGSGPIPPMVGLPTNYWVFFEIDNQGNDLSNLTVSAKIPETVTLSSGKTLSAGELVYDEAQKRITWKVNKAVINNGRYQAGFELQLFPVAKQIGTEPLLLTNISYVATDSYTGEKLSGKLSSINTELPLDAINQGEGKVLE